MFSVCFLYLYLLASDICTLPLFFVFCFVLFRFFLVFFFVFLFFLGGVLHATYTIGLHSYKKDENIDIDKTMKNQVKIGNVKNDHKNIQYYL